jgi:hypothetical protein
MKRVTRLFVLSLLLVALLVPLITSVALAHGQTTVGDYDIEIGFHNEPAYVNQPNGLDLFVTNSKTNEKVTGLEDTLKAEIIFGASKKELKIEATEVDGAYTAYVVPTAVGDYTWHIFGTIKGTPADISMTSSPTTFNSVETTVNYEFPAPDTTFTDLRTQADAAAKSAADASQAAAAAKQSIADTVASLATTTQSVNAANQALTNANQSIATASQAAATATQSAQTALIVGIVGAVLGVIGIVVGLAGRRSSRAA